MIAIGCINRYGVYGDLVYKFKKIKGRTGNSDQFCKVIICYKLIGYIKCNATVRMLSD